MCNFEVSMTAKMRRLHVSFQCITVISHSWLFAFCLSSLRIWQIHLFVFYWFGARSTMFACAILEFSFYCSFTTFCQHSKHMFIINQPRKYGFFLKLYRTKTKRLSTPNDCVAFSNFGYFFLHISCFIQYYKRARMLEIQYMSVCVCVWLHNQRLFHINIVWKINNLKSKPAIWMI